MAILRKCILMPTRDSKRRPVKRVPANAKQTRNKSVRKFRPTDEELLDPDNIHFSQEWAHILSDFDWSKGSIALAEKFVTDSRDAEIGHFPESNSPKERIDFALNTIRKLFKRVDKKIDARCIDLDFVWIWGEYQKAVAILQEALPELDRYLNVKRSSQNKSAAKSRARQWYMLWLEWYKQQPSSKRITRDVFNDYFQKLLHELRSGQRDIPRSIATSEFLALIDNFVTDPGDKESVQLSKGFTTKLSGAPANKALEDAKKNNGLPPVGIDYYPLKK